jgi:hypothetical protein
MYENIETEISYRYLSKVISRLDEPICILGGWAVFFAVNENFKKHSGRVYLGSRDIDLGFNTVSSFKKSALILEKELGFEFVSFRYFKNIHSETGKELQSQESKKLPQHMFFPLYVDIIFSYTNSALKKEIGFAPVDEPLLKHVFEKGKGIIATEYGKKLLLPMPEILLATKINSAPNRDKAHKKIKDICDITALCLFSGKELNEIIKSAKKISPEKSIAKFLAADFSDAIKECSKILNIELNLVNSVINKIRE